METFVTCLHVLVNAVISIPKLKSIFFIFLIIYKLVNIKTMAETYRYVLGFFIIIIHSHLKGRIVDCSETFVWFCLLLWPTPGSLRLRNAQKSQSRGVLPSNP